MSVVANVAINVDSRNAVSKLREVQSQAQQTERAFGGIAAAAGKLAIAFSAIQAAKFIFAKTAEIESQTRSLQVLTGSAEKAKQIIKELQDLGAVTPFTSTELIDAAKRLQAFGVEADKVVETTRRLADASGATGAELSGLVTAYGQVQAKGRLQGEELLQFQERGIALQEELRKMYGMTGDEFQKALSKGQVSAKAVEVALQRLTDVGGKYANGAIAQSDTLNGRLSTLQDSIQVLAQTIGRSLAPVFQWALSQATAVVGEIQRIIDEANNTGGARSREMQFARNAESAVRRMNLNPFTQQGMMAEMRQRNIEQQRADYRLRQQASRPAAAPAPAGAPALLGATGGDKKKKGKSDAEKAAELAAKQAEQLMGAKMQLDLARQLFAIENRVIAARFEGNKPLELARETQKELATIANEAAAIKADKDVPAAEKLVKLDLLKVKSAEAARKLAVDIAQIEIDRNKSFDQIIADLDLELALKTATTEQAREQLRLEAEIAKIRGDKSLTPEQKESIIGRKTELATAETPAQKIYSQMQKDLEGLIAIENVARDGAKGIGDAFGVAFQDILSGSVSAQEALANMMKSIGENFLSMAAQIIAQQVTMIIFGTIMKALGVSMPGSGGGGGGFTGGPSAPAVDFGFTPSFGSGFGARANGGPVFANAPYVVGEQGPELFTPAMGGTITSNRDLRSAMNAGGGGAAGAPVLNMSFETTNIGGVEYVSRDQLEQAMAETRRSATRDGAQRGMSMTLDRIQNSSSTRRRIGV